MPLGLSVYSAERLATAVAHPMASTLAATATSWLAANAATVAGDGAAATNANISALLYNHSVLFALTGTTTYRANAITSGTAFSASWATRNLTGHEITSQMPGPWARRIANAMSLDSALFDALEPAATAMLTGIGDGTYAETEIGKALGCRVGLTEVLNEGTSPFDGYGSNAGLNTLLTSSYFHATGYPYWFKGSTWYAIINVIPCLRWAGEKYYASMSAPQQATYDAVMRMPIALHWHGVTLHVGEDMESGLYLNSLTYPTVGYGWYWPQSDDDAKWCRYQFQRRIGVDVTLGFDDLTVEHQTSAPIAYPLHNLGTVAMGDHLELKYASGYGAIRQNWVAPSGQGLNLSGGHTTDTGLPQVSFFGPDGLLLWIHGDSMATIDIPCDLCTYTDDDNPTVNHGTETTAKVGVGPAGETYRAVFRADLSALSGTEIASIIAISVGLHFTRGSLFGTPGSLDYYLFAIGPASGGLMVENEITHNVYKTGSAWTFTKTAGIPGTDDPGFERLNLDAYFQDSISADGNAVINTGMFGGTPIGDLVTDTALSFFMCEYNETIPANNEVDTAALIRTDDHATTGDRPFVRLAYTADTVVGGGGRARWRGRGR